MAILPSALTHSLTHSPTHSLTHSLTHPLTHSLTHSLTFSLTQSPARSLVVNYVNTISRAENRSIHSTSPTPRVFARLLCRTLCYLHYLPHGYPTRILSNGRCYPRLQIKNHHFKPHTCFCEMHNVSQMDFYCTAWHRVIGRASGARRLQYAVFFSLRVVPLEMPTAGGRHSSGACHSVTIGVAGLGQDIAD